MIKNKKNNVKINLIMMCVPLTISEVATFDFWTCYFFPSQLLYSFIVLNKNAEKNKETKTKDWTKQCILLYGHIYSQLGVMTLETTWKVVCTAFHYCRNE